MEIRTKFNMGDKVVAYPSGEKETFGVINGIFSDFLATDLAPLIRYEVKYTYGVDRTDWIGVAEKDIILRKDYNGDNPEKKAQPIELETR